MRLVSEINQEPACPQCGHDGGDDSQADIGQHRCFIEFSRSEAISVMEQYDSLSSDRADEREHTLYHRRRSFDLTVDAPTGAVGEETLPFGIEYRAAVVLREVNVGYFDEPVSVAFGPEGLAPDRGFQVCVDCGVVAPVGKSIEQIIHRRSCSARRRQEKVKAEGRSTNPFKSESVYLYREIRSEAIRILIPPLSEDEIATLEACLLLGLRLRFEGDPSHLTIFPQKLPDGENNLQRDYLIILDRVPGGTGYLKTLFQETDTAGRAGEGIMSVMRQSLDALESCRCGRLSAKDSDRDTDGCYRCIRTYSQQYSATSISRERGIKLLKQLITAGERRLEHQALTEIPNTSLLGSALERKLISKLEEWVTEHNGIWEKNLVRGKIGYRFTLPTSNRTWELELQPQLSISQGVAISCQPDFMLWCVDDESIQPVAIFTDGFEFHVETNRLADDMAKRRAILASGRYHIWSLTWDDLTAPNLEDFLVVPKPVGTKLEIFATAISKGLTAPWGKLAIGNAWQQLTGFIQYPEASSWRRLAEFTAAFPLEILAATRAHAEPALHTAINNWCSGQNFIMPPSIDTGEWVCNDRTSGGTDVIALATIADCLANRRDRVRVIARLGDSEPERLAAQTYRSRWRKFLACLNLLQFCGAFTFFTTSEVEAGTAPDVIGDTSSPEASGEWVEVREEVILSLRYLVDELAAAGVPIPQAAYEDESIHENAVAEMAWIERSHPIAILAGDQALLVSAWQTHGWTVVTANELQAKGSAFFLELVANNT